MYKALILQILPKVWSFNLKLYKEAAHQAIFSLIIITAIKSLSLIDLVINYSTHVLRSSLNTTSFLGFLKASATPPPFLTASERLSFPARELGRITYLSRLILIRSCLHGGWCRLRHPPLRASKLVRRLTPLRLPLRLRPRLIVSPPSLGLLGLDVGCLVHSSSCVYRHGLGSGLPGPSPRQWKPPAGLLLLVTVGSRSNRFRQLRYSEAAQKTAGLPRFLV